MTGAYAALANRGNGVWPYGIEQILDADGNVLYKRSGGGPYNIVTTAVWESEEAYAAAKTATATRFQAIGLNPPEIMRALDVQVDRGVYVRTPY